MIGRHWRKAVSFGGIGLGLLVVGQVILFGLIEVGRWNEFLANGVQLAVTLACNFLLNSWITWRDRRRNFGAFAKFVSSRVFTIALSFGIFWLLVGVFGCHYLLANLIGVGISMVANYVVSEVWVFRKLEEG